MSAVLTDAQLRADLRSVGLRNPSDDHLASYRRYREFGSDVVKLNAIPAGGGRFKRALTRVGIVPPAKPGDADLVAASASMRAALRDVQATGPGATDEEDRHAWARFDTADATILTTPATTVSGALAKLRRAIVHEVGEDWVEHAIAEGDITTLAARVEELPVSSRLLVETLCALELVAAAQ